MDTVYIILQQLLLFTLTDLLSQEIKEKIFQKFEEFLHEIFPKGRLE